MSPSEIPKIVCQKIRRVRCGDSAGLVSTVLAGGAKLDELERRRFRALASLK